MKRVNVRVLYPFKDSVLASQIEHMADLHQGVWWCGGNLSDSLGESNFAFGHRESAFGFVLRINLLPAVRAAIDFEVDD